MTVKEIAHELKIIKENHLKHIEQDMNLIRTQVGEMDRRLWAILLILVAGFIGIVLKGQI